MATPTAPLKVFLAEDSELIRSRIAEMLAAHAMDVAGCAATPRGCIDGIIAARPDVVVLDVQLEGGTGLEVLRAVRAAAPGIAFVAFSNSSGPAWRKRYLAEGAARYLDKTTEFGLLPGALQAAAAAAAAPAGKVPAPSTARDATAPAAHKA